MCSLCRDSGAGPLTDFMCACILLAPRMSCSCSVPQLLYSLHPGAPRGRGCMIPESGTLLCCWDNRSRAILVRCVQHLFVTPTHKPCPACFIACSAAPPRHENYKYLSADVQLHAYCVTDHHERMHQIDTLPRREGATINPSSSTTTPRPKGPESTKIHSSKQQAATL